jgi:hypothetical protein
MVVCGGHNTKIIKGGKIYSTQHDRKCDYKSGVGSDIDISRHRFIQIRKVEKEIHIWMITVKEKTNVSCYDSMYTDFNYISMERLFFLPQLITHTHNTTRHMALEMQSGVGSDIDISRHRFIQIRQVVKEIYICTNKTTTI